MAGHRCTQADFYRLHVTHLTDQNNVRILAQYRAQYAAECQVDFRIDLHLVNSTQAVFDGILNSYNFYCGIIKFLERTIESRCFAAPGSAEYFPALPAR